MDPAAAPPPRGTLLQTPQVLSLETAASLVLQLNNEEQLAALVENPLCDIALLHMRYATLGGVNEATEASAALMVPTGADAKCTGVRPIVLYAHGTTTARDFNIATVDNNSEGLVLAAFFASQGYIVVAPNYAGYDTSTLPYHPYLVADQQSKDMIDALRAARSALPVVSAVTTTDSGRLFITGYSQGGYVAMATHRAMQDAGMAVVASAPMSGPYALGAFVDTVVFGRVSGGAPVSWTLLISAYQNSYGNIYGSSSDIFESQYATGIDSLLPSLTPRSDLYAQGKLPRSALFNATSPDPLDADITPATEPASLAAVFANGFGSDNLVTNTYRASYLADARSNPDGGWPTVTTDAPAATPGLALRQALKRNDLRDWTPTAPVLLCGGNSDPVVFWLNTELMQGLWSRRSSVPFSVLDLDSNAAAGDPFETLKNRFALAKDLIAATAVAQGATDGGAAAVLEAYHAGLVPPFCLAAVSSFFSAQ